MKRKSIIWILLGLVVAVYFFIPLKNNSANYSTVLFDSKGNLMGASIAEDGQWRFPAGDSIPKKVATCVQYFEDEHFYKHFGINPFSVGRAIWQNISKGKIISGASTLTMQIARMRRNKPRNLWQKLMEMCLAVKLELHYSKQSLMNQYLSMAPFGGNVVGLEAASWRYYERPPYLLSWGEVAALAVLPNNPSRIFPGKSEQVFKKKRNLLLHKLLRKNLIDTLTYQISLLENLPSKPKPIPQKTNHLLATAKQKGNAARLETSLSPFWQERVSAIIERRHKYLKGNGIDNACALVVDLKTSNVLAYVGNTNDKQAEGNQVDIIQRPRSPGSSLKPFLYAQALSRGKILPKTLLKDIPAFFGGFMPKNFNGGYFGAVPADEALARSLNIPFVFLLKEYTYEQFHLDLQKAGISTLPHSPNHYGLSLILGGGEVTVWELTNLYNQLYQQLKNGKAQTISYLKNQKEIQESTYIDLDNAAIWHTFQAMTQLKRPTSESDWKAFSSSQLVAWKTGTSMGHRDAWAVGLNGSVLVAVWVGNADGEGRAGLTGIKAAAPLFHQIMRLSDHNPNWLDQLKPIMKAKNICKISGMLASEFCEYTSELVTNLAENTPKCPYHQQFYMNEKMTHQVNSSCYELAKANKQIRFVLPSAMGSYYAMHHPLYQGMPPFEKGCKGDNQNPIGIIYPNKKSKVFIPKLADGQKGKVILEASHQNMDATLYWHINNQFFGTTQDGTHDKEVFLSAGAYTLLVMDEKGNERKRIFEVVGE